MDAILTAATEAADEALERGDDPISTVVQYLIGTSANEEQSRHWSRSQPDKS